MLFQSVLEVLAYLSNTNCTRNEDVGRRALMGVENILVYKVQATTATDATCVAVAW